MEAHNCRIERNAFRLSASFSSMVVSTTVLPSLKFLKEQHTISSKLEIYIWENAKVRAFNAIRGLLKCVYLDLIGIPMGIQIHIHEM